MIQAPLLPVVCTRTRPPPGPTTIAADFLGIEDSTTHRWLCKGQRQVWWLPATEWICSHLALACGLPVSPVAIVEVPAYGNLRFFGSQWQGGAMDYLHAKGRITNADVFSRTHAVDLFVNNTDRHTNNFLYLDLAGECVARVIDFSHSLLMDWPMPALPMPSGCNTLAALGRLLREGPYTRPTAVLGRIASLPDEWMRDTLEPMPDSWMPREVRIDLREWWVGTARKARLAAAESELP